MRRLFPSVLKSEAGQSLLLVIVLVDAVILVALWFFTHFTEMQTNARLTFVKRFLLEETVSSSFEVMEAALRRRLWESPPDSSCLKSTKFFVTGLRSDLKLKWGIEATYNPSTHVYDLASTGGYYSDPITKTFLRDLKVSYHKQVKVLDASDFLILNTGASGLSLSRTYESSTPAGLIAGGRRIYLKGPASLMAYVYPATPYATSWAPSGSNFNYYSVILQGERIQVGGGIKYSPSYMVNMPDEYSCPFPSGGAPNGPGVPNWSVPICSALKPWISEPPPAWAPDNRFQGQSAAGAALFFGGSDADKSLALKLNEEVTNCRGGINCPYPAGLDMSEVKKHVYPVALFGGDSSHYPTQRPLVSSSASDNGTFVNDPDGWSIFLYNYTANHWGMLTNFTCLLDLNSSNPECSNSEKYPKGFKSWKHNAGLDAVLYTKDTEEIAASAMDWDNYEALLEDARSCGKVVEKGASPSYEDCQVWDQNFLNQYVSGYPTVPACHQVTKVSLDGSAFTNFDESAYEDDDLKDRLLRRVIYAKGPTELTQLDKKGLRTAMTNAKRRDRLTVWMVSEDVINLRGNKDADPTPPSQGDYSRLREVVFNADGTVPSPPPAGSTPFPPLRLVLMTPELVHLISPGYKPMTSTHFKNSYEKRFGSLYPKIPQMLDDERYEQDAFLYGLRKFRIENMVLISNANQSSPQGLTDGFFFKGMWSGWDSSAQQYITNQCLFNRDGMRAGDPPFTNVADYPATRNPAVPASHIGVNGMPSSGWWVDELGNYKSDFIRSGGTTYVPPLTSNYYQHDGGETWVPYLYYPYIFTAQMMSTSATSAGIRESTLSYTGLHLQVMFDPTFTAPAQHDLSQSQYASVETAQVNLKDKKYYWKEKPYYFLPSTEANDGDGHSCGRGMTYFLDGSLAVSGTYDYINDYYHVNNGKHVFQHTSPSGNLSNLGSLFGVDLPMVQTRE